MSNGVKINDSSLQCVKEWQTKSGYMAEIWRTSFSMVIPLKDINVSDSFKKMLDKEWYCGYVRVPENHILFGKNCSDIPIKVHNKNVTYADFYRKDFHFWNIGFDCADAADTMKVYNLDKVTDMCEDLASKCLNLDQSHTNNNCIYCGNTCTNEKIICHECEKGNSIKWVPIFIVLAVMLISLLVLADIIYTK